MGSVTGAPLNPIQRTRLRRENQDRVSSSLEITVSYGRAARFTFCAANAFIVLNETNSPSSTQRGCAPFMDGLTRGKK